MKQSILILALLATVCRVSAQTIPKDTTRKTPLYFGDVLKMNESLQRATQLYHGVKMDALKRDSIDGYLNSIYYLINRRAQSVYSDTVKNVKPLKK